MILESPFLNQLLRHGISRCEQHSGRDTLCQDRARGQLHLIPGSQSACILFKNLIIIGSRSGILTIVTSLRPLLSLLDCVAEGQEFIVTDSLDCPESYQSKRDVCGLSSRGRKHYLEFSVMLGDPDVLFWTK